MKKTLLLIAFLTLAFQSFSQDVITRTNGESIKCKITKTDSTTVFFDLLSNGSTVSTSLDRSKIKEIQYENYQELHNTESIIMKKGLGGYQFYQAGKVLRVAQLVKILEPNELAYNEIKAAQSNYVFAMILGSAGGFMVGWQLGTAVGGGEPNWTMAGIGAGLIVVSIPISQKFNKQAKGAIDIYNRGLETSSFWDKNELNFVMTSNSLGLTLRF